MSDVECYVYDFTLTAGDIGPDTLHSSLNGYCKAWTFQLERGTECTEKNPDGYLHYQGRFSLIKKKRAGHAAKLFRDKGLKDIHLSPTSKEQAASYSKSKEAFYCLKEDTRVAGPWTDEDYRAKPDLVWPYNEEKWDPPLPWMATLIEKLSTRSKRVIHCLIDKKGASGKTSFGMYCLSKGLAFRVPPFNDLNDIYGVVMAYPGQKGYLFDMPRSVPKGKLQGMYAGIEEIKNGYCCDKRYHFKFKTFDSPNVIVFTNEKPNLSYLSRDRWLLWQITGNELVPYRDESEEEGAADGSWVRGQEDSSSREREDDLSDREVQDDEGESHDEVEDKKDD